MQATKPQEASKIDMVSQGYEKGTVIDYPIDGCRYLIELESSRKLEPINLQENFKKDSLSVWLKYQPVRNIMSICMTGEMVKITAIEVRIDK